MNGQGLLLTWSLASFNFLYLIIFIVLVPPPLNGPQAHHPMRFMSVVHPTNTITSLSALIRFCSYSFTLFSSTALLQFLFFSLVGPNTPPKTNPCVVVVKYSTPYSIIKILSGKRCYLKNIHISILTWINSILKKFVTLQLVRVQI